MNEETSTEEQPWVVRLWDGFDGEWMDVSEPMSEADARKLAGDKNEGRVGAGAGNRDGHYGEIDYYKAFPSDTKMTFSEGYSQTRGLDAEHAVNVFEREWTEGRLSEDE